MTEQDLIGELAASVPAVPSDVEILGVRPPTQDEMMRRTKRVLVSVGEMMRVPFDRADWVQQRDTTLGRLPMGARVVMYHASGVMRFVAGLPPMELLFTNTDRGYLMKLVETAAERLRVNEWVNTRESLMFERLWQIKASAADRDGKVTVPPVLCRVVGAYRHVVGNLPVLGAASVAIRLAGGAALDSLSIQIRETNGERIEWAPVVRPEEAARQIVRQLATLMGRSKIPFTELARPEGMQIGYLSLGKRTPQRVLAPHYVASIAVEGEEAQAYQLVVPATERTYLPLPMGQHPPAATAQRKVPITERPTVPRAVREAEVSPAVREQVAPAYKVAK
jgi:hypothetical protein